MSDDGDGKAALHKGKGKVKETVGWVTGDRGVEAEGLAEQDQAAAGSAGEEPGESDVKRAKRRVRKAHGDIP